VAKKNKGRPGKGNRNRSGDPRKSAAGQAPASLGLYRVERRLAAVTPDFVDWYAESLGPAEEAMACLDIVKAVAATYSEVTGEPGVTEFEPLALGDMMDEIEAADPDEALMVFAVFHLFIDFLHETGKWTGSEEDYVVVHSLLAEQEPELEMPLVKVPRLPEAEETEFFAALPLIQRARALMEWLGEGKQVTATAVLRLKDIEAAAACVGVAARGGRNRPTSDEGMLPGLSDLPGEPATDKVMMVQSMHDVPVLSPLWQTLVASGAIEIRSTRAVPHRPGTGLLEGTGRDHLEECRVFVSRFLQQAVVGTDEDQPWEVASTFMQAAALTAACTEEPPLLERFLDAESRAPEEEKHLARLVTRISYSRLQKLAELGLVELDSHIRVPQPLIRCVAEALQDDFDLEVEYPEGEGLPTTPSASARTGQTPSSVYQLKIALKGSKPPIWRRVLVPSTMRLDGLHDVIQLVFAWEDYHLHHFQVGGRHGTTYGRPDPHVDIFGEPPVDESTVQVSDLLAREGDNVTYTYDFGDDWEHVITLEKIMEPDGGALPRCTGGRGAAPAEDSGGIWGWMDTVDAVNDPSHERHAELRDWLGLAPGESLDPKEFSVTEADAALAVLR
jgi:hypothetical protein